MKVGTVKSSTLAALSRSGWNAGHLLAIKERLDGRGAEETVGNVLEESAAMKFEALARMRRARELRSRAAELEAEAREHEAEASLLANEKPANLARRLGP